VYKNLPLFLEKVVGVLGMAAGASVAGKVKNISLNLIVSFFYST
jgi:hypothetical protein